MKSGRYEKLVNGNWFSGGRSIVQQSFTVKPNFTCTFPGGGNGTSQTVEYSRHEGDQRDGLVKYISSIYRQCEETNQKNEPKFVTKRSIGKGASVKAMR